MSAPAWQSTKFLCFLTTHCIHDGSEWVSRSREREREECNRLRRDLRRQLLMCITKTSSIWPPARFCTSNFCSRFCAHYQKKLICVKYTFVTVYWRQWQLTIKKCFGGIKKLRIDETGNEVGNWNGRRWRLEDGPGRKWSTFRASAFIIHFKRAQSVNE